MATVKTWLVSAALVGGASGGATVVLAAQNDQADPAPSAQPAITTPNAQHLQTQIDTLLREDHALKKAVRQARVRLASRVHASEHTLNALQQRIVTARNELAQAQVARSRAPTVTVAAPPAPAPPVAAPPSHTTTGASGAGSGHGDDGGHEHEGGGDD